MGRAWGECVGSGQKERRRKRTPEPFPHGLLPGLRAYLHAIRFSHDFSRNDDHADPATSPWSGRELQLRCCQERTTLLFSSTITHSSALAHPATQPRVRDPPLRECLCKAVCLCGRIDAGWKRHLMHRLQAPACGSICDVAKRSTVVRERSYLLCTGGCLNTLGPPWLLAYEWSLIVNHSQPVADLRTRWRAAAAAALERARSSRYSRSSSAAVRRPLPPPPLGPAHDAHANSAARLLQGDSIPILRSDHNHSYRIQSLYASEDPYPPSSSSSSSYSTGHDPTCGGPAGPASES